MSRTGAADQEETGTDTRKRGPGDRNRLPGFPRFGGGPKGGPPNPGGPPPHPQPNKRSRENSMKLVRYGAPGREKPGIIDADGKIRDLSRVVKDIDGAMLASGGLAKIKKANLKRLKVVGGKPRLGPCVGNVRNFIAIGLNYSDHAAEGGNPIPKEPVVFNKAPTCICGPERRHHDPEGFHQARLRMRARHRDRQARALSQPRTRRWTRSPAIASATTCRSARSRWSTGKPSARARAPRPSGRSAPGS